MAQITHMSSQFSSASAEQRCALQLEEVQEKQKQQITLDSLCSQQTTLKKCRPFFKQPHNPNNLIVSQKNQSLDRSQGISPTLCSPSDFLFAKDNQNAMFLQCLKKQSIVRSTIIPATTGVIDGPAQQVSSLVSPRQKRRNDNSSSSRSSCGKNNNISSEEDGRFDNSPRFQESKKFKQTNSQLKQFGIDTKGSADKTIAKISRLLYLSDEKQENIHGKETVDRLFDRAQYNRIPLQAFSENIYDIQYHSQPHSGTKNNNHNNNINNNSSVDRINQKNEPTEECPYLQSSGKKQQYFFTTPNKHEGQLFRYGSASQVLCSVSGNNYFKPKPFGSPNQSPRQRYQEAQQFKSTYPGDDIIEKRQGRVGNSSSEQKNARQIGQSSFASLPDRCVVDYDCSMDYQQYQSQFESLQPKQQQQIGSQQFYQINSQQFYQYQQQQIIQGTHNNSNSIISGYYQDNLPSQQIQDNSNVGGDIFPANSGYLSSSSFRNISSIQPQQQQQHQQKFLQQLMGYEDQRQQQQQAGLFPAQNLNFGYQLGSHVSFGQRSSQQQMIYPNNSIQIGYSSDNSIQNNNTNSHINFDEGQEEFSLVGKTHDPSEADGDQEGNQSCKDMKSIIESNQFKAEEELQQQQKSNGKKDKKQEKQKKNARQSIKLSEGEVVSLNEAPRKRRSKSKVVTQNIQPQQQTQLPRQCVPQKLEKKSTADLQKSKKSNKQKIDCKLNDDSEEQTGDQQTPNKGLKGVTRNKFDTKNLVKNFLNQFLSFASSTDPKEQLEVCSVLKVEKVQLTGYQERLRQFLKHSKYNRQLFKEFIHVEQFRVLFTYFLQHKAQGWIENGRMKDKLSHFRALSNFTYISENHDTVKSWRFRYNFV